MQWFPLHLSPWLLKNTVFTIPPVLCLALPHFDKAVSDTVYQTAAKHKTCVKRPSNLQLLSTSCSPSMISSGDNYALPSDRFLLCTSHEGSVKTCSTFSIRLPPVCIWSNSAGCWYTFSYTLHTEFIATESVVFAFSMSSTSALLRKYLRSPAWPLCTEGLSRLSWQSKCNRHLMLDCRDYCRQKHCAFSLVPSQF